MSCSRCRFWNKNLCYRFSARNPTQRNPDYLCPEFRLFLTEHWYKSKTELIMKLQKILSQWDHILDDKGEKLIIHLFQPNEI